MICEENMQKLVKVVNMRNPQEGELPGSPKGVLRKLQGGTQWSQIGTPGDPWGLEILRAHCYQYDLGGFSGKSYRRREIHETNAFFELSTFYQYDLGG